MKFAFKSILFLFLITIATAGFFLYQKYIQSLTQTININNDTRIFEIKSGSGIRQVANLLEQKKIIPSAHLFVLMAKEKNLAHKMKAGEYELNDEMTAEGMLDRFVSGKTLQYKLSIIDGKTVQSIFQKVRDHPQLKQTLSENDYQNIMQKLGSKYTQPEGWFFPDTYNFPRKNTDFKFLQRSYHMMKSFLHQEWRNRNPHPNIKTPYEALILASIVEKETGVKSERPLIARVFLNRLERGMKLQTDPTVIYGMGKRFRGNIRKSDLQRDTPYNSYTRLGLPPTPIATPSKAAIRAVMHPIKSKALYFVARGNGTSQFSDNYSDHKKAVIKYQLQGKAKRYTGNQ